MTQAMVLLDTAGTWKGVRRNISPRYAKDIHLNLVDLGEGPSDPFFFLDLRQPN